MPNSHQENKYIVSTPIQEADLFMESEVYNIELEIHIQELEKNFVNSNIFVTSQFSSISSQREELKFQRMGSLEVRHPLIVLAKEFLNYIPFAGKVFDLSLHQLIRIKIVENFNNAEFSTSQIKFQLQGGNPGQ